MHAVEREHAEPADVRPWGDAVLVTPLGQVVTVSDPSDSDPSAESALVIEVDGVQVAVLPAGSAPRRVLQACRRLGFPRLEARWE